MSGPALFIYWHTSPGDAPAAEAAIRSQQARWRGQLPGLDARLYRRSDAAGDRVTLMETYAMAGGLSAVLQARLLAEAESSLGHWALGGRHVEDFESAD